MSRLPFGGFFAEPSFARRSLPAKFAPLAKHIQTRVQSRCNRQGVASAKVGLLIHYAKSERLGVEQGPRPGAHLEDAASDLGAQGWELVLCFPLPNALFKILFKRPI
jgi:hypothetical protein